jgi:hypothetical protein
MTGTRLIVRVVAAALLVALMTLPRCAPLSTSVSDPAVGLNGGFEHVQDGLPVNWIVYAPETIPTGQYDLAFDASVRREGRQSLRFDVASCSDAGGWRSPGIATEVPAVRGATYRVTLWVRTDGGVVVVRAGTVAAKTGRTTVIDAGEGGPTGAWRRVEHIVTVPAEHERIRLEIGIRAPGRVWVDDVRVERIDETAAVATRGVDASTR